MAEVLFVIVALVVAGTGWLGWELSARRSMRRYRVIQELYGFMVSELDPEPHPIEAYLVDPELQREARRCVGPASPQAWLWVVGMRHESAGETDGQ